MKTGSSKYCYLLLVLILLLAASPVPDKRRSGGKNRDEDRDSLLTLLSAEYARVFERVGGREYREVKGPATFLHNGAYMFCDSAIWNVSFNQIEAYNNIKMVHDKTVITSDNVIYYADENLARFRGELVEVYDKDKNTLRTRYLDYNTQDSVAKFSFGGAMKTAKGEVIESDRGTYDAKTGICRFEDNVEMFTDSLFIKTASLDYDTNEGKAYFGKKTQMWKNDVYIRGEYGWYMQDSGVVYFDTNVYMDNPDYEAWCDTLHYWQHTRRGQMRKNVQLLDSLHKVYFLSDAGDLSFDSVNNIYATLFLDPASVFVGENSEKRVDTMFIRADTLHFYTVRACDITDEMRKDSEEVMQQVTFDAIGEADRKAQAKKEQELKEAIEKLPEFKAYQKRKEIAQQKLQDSINAAEAAQRAAAEKAAQDSVAAFDVADAAAADSLGAVQTSTESEPSSSIPKAFSNAADAAPDSMVAAAADSLGAPLAAADTAALPAADSAADTTALSAADSTSAEDGRDTTQIRFVKGWRNAKIYRTDIQARCDSLYFSQLDTLLRMYQDPVIWNEGRHQLSGESVVMKVKDNSFDRANLHGNAMIISQEDTVHFDQIKSTEMLGYFNADNTLRRFDALGGVNAMFFMQEDSVITMLNSKQAQYMMVTMKNGTAERLKYYETVESDAFPVYDLPRDKQRLKGFKWRLSEQPKSRMEITDRTLRYSRRASYAANKLPVFRRTNLYFDDYMKDIYLQIEQRAQQAIEEQARRDSLEAASQEQLSLASADTTAGIAAAFDRGGEIIIDSLAALKPAPDTASRDSLNRVSAALRERDSLAVEAEKAARAAQAVRDSLMGRPKPAMQELALEGLETHSDEGFVEIKIGGDQDKKLTFKEKRAIRRAERAARRAERKAIRAARRAERRAAREARQAERAPSASEVDNTD